MKLKNKRKKIDDAGNFSSPIAKFFIHLTAKKLI
jgi:hypothetical protein